MIFLGIYSLQRGKKIMLSEEGVHKIFAMLMKTLVFIKEQELLNKFLEDMTPTMQEMYRGVIE